MQQYSLQKGLLAVTQRSSLMPLRLKRAKGPLFANDFECCFVKRCRLKSGGRETREVEPLYSHILLHFKAFCRADRDEVCHKKDTSFSLALSRTHNLSLSHTQTHTPIHTRTHTHSPTFSGFHSKCNHERRYVEKKRKLCKKIWTDVKKNGKID